MSGDLAFLAVFGGVFLAVLSAVLALGGGLEGGRRKRIDAVRERASVPEQDRPSLVRDDSGASGVERFFGRFLPNRAQLRLRLQRAGLAMSLGRYATITVGVGLVATAILKLLISLPLMLAVLIGIAAGVILPHWTVKFLIARRTLRFQQLFPEAIDLMVRGLRSGLPISETIVNVGEEMSEPVGAEFRTVADAVRLGATLDDALWETARRIDIAEFRFFTISLSVQRQTGGNLGETLANLSDILRKRLAMKLKVKAMSSEARASAYIIGSLPFVMIGILLVMSPDYVMALFTDPRGLMMVGVGVVMILIGAGVMYKMVRFEV